MNLKSGISALLLITVLASCVKESNPDVQGDWLVPIAKGELSINTLKLLENLEYDLQIPALSLGLPENTPVSSPGLHIDHVGPFPFQVVSWIHRVDIDTLEFSGSLQNFFPIPISAGTTVTLRNSPDTSAASVLGAFVLDHDVSAGGSIDFDMQIRNKSLGDSAYISLDNFTSPAFTNVTFSSTPARLKVKLNVLAAMFLEVYTNKTFSSDDTTTFSAGDNDQNLGPVDTSSKGYINVFADNGLPANIRWQLYFLNESKTQVVDSLFSQEILIQGGQTDISGNTTSTSHSKTPVVVSQKRLDNIKRAKYVASHFEFNTNGYGGPYVWVSKGPRLIVQLVGDLTIRINF
jgi:hypothetical protein